MRDDPALTGIISKNINSGNGRDSDSVQCSQLSLGLIITCCVSSENSVNTADVSLEKCSALDRSVGRFLTPSAAWFRQVPRHSKQ